MKPRRKRAILVAFYLLYAFVYAGWLFHRCREPVLGLYSVKYIVFLAVMVCPFLLPLLYRLLARSVGTKRLKMTAVMVAICFALIYLISALHYYATQQHAFDPFFSPFSRRSC